MGTKTISITEEAYEILYEIINARNALAHVYDKTRFEEIYKKLFEYLPIIKETTKVIKGQNN